MLWQKFQLSSKKFILKLPNKTNLFIWHSLATIIKLPGKLICLSDKSFFKYTWLTIKYRSLHLELFLKQSLTPTWCMADVWLSGSRGPPPLQHTGGSSQTARGRSGAAPWWRWSGAGESANSHSPSCPVVLEDWRRIKKKMKILPTHSPYPYL